MAACMFERYAANSKSATQTGSVWPPTMSVTPGPSPSSSSASASASASVSASASASVSPGQVKVESGSGLLPGVSSDSPIHTSAFRHPSAFVQKPATTSTNQLIRNDPSDVLLHQLAEFCNDNGSGMDIQSAGTRLFPDSETTAISGWNAPFLFESDRASSTIKTTRLGAHLISCFVVGGEVRLCAPQVYGVILNNISSNDLAHCIRDRKVFDQLATPDQLQCLKNKRAIPPGKASCGLITKTNAERLMALLIDHEDYRSLPADRREKLDPILIQHDCFGGCQGRLYTSLYPRTCVECIECACLMTTEAFCRHSHQLDDCKAIHWGFDSFNWRSYIRTHDLDEKNFEAQELLRKFLQEDSKNFLFDPPLPNSAACKIPYDERTLENDIADVFVKSEGGICSGGEEKVNEMNAGSLAMAATILQHQQQQQQHQQQQQSQNQASGSSSGFCGPPPMIAPPTNNAPPFGSPVAPGGGLSSSAPTSSGVFQTPGGGNLSGGLANMLLQMQLGALLNDRLKAAAGVTPKPQENVHSRSEPANVSVFSQQQQPQPQQANPPTAADLQTFFAGLQTGQLNQLLQNLRQIQQGQQQPQPAPATVATAPESLDTPEIPRKRAYTVSDPMGRKISSDSTIVAPGDVPRPKLSLNLPNSLAFGALPIDQSVVHILKQALKSEVCDSVIESINASLTARIQPLASENARLRAEVAQLRRERYFSLPASSTIAQSSISEDSEMVDVVHDADGE